MRTNRFAIVVTWGLLGVALSLLWSMIDLPQTTTSLAATSTAMTGQTHPIAQESSPPRPWVDVPADGLPSAFKPGELLIKFKEGTPPQTAEGLLQQHSAARIRVLYDGCVELWQVPEGDELAIVTALRAEPSVEYAEPDFVYHVAGVPNDPDYGNQWAHPLMQSPAAWDISTGASSVTIAVIDTGIDLGHPDLAARIVAGYDFVDGDSDPSDTNGHGTHVSGIAAAVTNNGVGVAGMDWNAQLMPIRVLNTQGTGFTSDIVDGINWAWQQGANILNLSLGGPSYSQAMQDAVTAAHNAGSLVVAGMGNDNSSTPQYPAAYSNVLAVAATGPTDTKASYSNYGAHCDLAAPGGDMSYYHDPAGIYSTMPTYPVYLTTNYSYYENYDYLNGTSQAAPYVSGLAALIWSVAPGLAQDQVQTFIETTAVDLGSPGWDQYYGHGRIDALAAVQAAASATQWTVCPAGPPNCDFSIIQDAVDAAGAGDTIKIATGSYTGVHARPSPPGYDGPAVITQVVYISKTLALRGGYTTTNWLTPDPEANPTTLDAQGQGRVLFITGPISPAVEGLRLTGGDASGLGGLVDDDAGGGVYVINATATFSNCTIYGNTASPAPESYGGGLFLLRHSLKLG